MISFKLLHVTLHRLHSKNTKIPIEVLHQLRTKLILNQKKIYFIGLPPSKARVRSWRDLDTVAVCIYLTDSDFIQTQPRI